VNINGPTVSTYAERLSNGEVMPPLDVFFDGKQHFLAGGFHRYDAYVANNVKTVPCRVRNGDLEAAKKFSLGQNHSHGLPRSTADKKRCVKMARELYGEDKSQVFLAELCGVSRVFVAEQINGKTSPSRKLKALSKASPNGGGASVTPPLSVGDGDVALSKAPPVGGGASVTPPPVVGDEREAGDDTAQIAADHKAERRASLANGKVLKVSKKDAKTCMDGICCIMDQMDMLGIRAKHQDCLNSFVEVIQQWGK
jgi:hypothetical protein